jgi:hypothetical protein
LTEHPLSVSWFIDDAWTFGLKSAAKPHLPRERFGPSYIVLQFGLRPRWRGPRITNNRLKNNLPSPQ